jgi:AraC family transcriptional regulator
MLTPGDNAPMRLPAGQYFGQTASTFATPSFHLSESQYEQRERLPLHAHENAHFCFVDRGSYTELLDGRLIERRAGDLMFYPAGQPHAEDHRDQNRHFLIELTPRLISAAVAVRIPMHAPREVRGRTARTIVSRLYRECTDPDGVSALAAEALLLELLAATGRQTMPRASGAPWLRRVEEALRTRFTEPIGLDDAAAIAGVHPVHVARVFRRQHGCSIGEFVRRARIDAARTELADGNVSIAEIALRLGFADQSHFHRTFKRITGLTPSEFRARTR